MTQSLKERLREQYGDPETGAFEYVNPDGPAAVQEIERLERRNIEVSRLAHQWMVAHDRLKAGLPYDLPTPDALLKSQDQNDG